MPNHKLVLIDGHHLIHRAFHAHVGGNRPPLTIRRTGEDVSGAYGFMQMMLKSAADLQPTHMVVTFDRPTPTFRHEMFSEYKATRRETPQLLRDQFPHVRRLIDVFRIPIVELDGFEADDLLGTLASQAQELEIETIIITGDTDVLQVVEEHVRVLRPNGQLYGEREVIDYYGGIKPAQVIDYKALCGDTSDNIPGVPGVGPKTAKDLLNAYGSLAGIYDNLANLKPKHKELLTEHRLLAFRAQKLVTIVRDAPVHLDLDGSRWRNYTRTQVVSELRDMEFFSLIGRVPEATKALNIATIVAGTNPSKTPKHDYILVDTREALTTLSQTLIESDGFSFDTETSPEEPSSKGIHPVRSRLVGVSLSTEQGRAWYVPVGHATGQQLSLSEVLNALREPFEDEAIPKTAHNANFDITVLGNQGIWVKGLAFDTMLAAHLLGYRAIGLKEISLELLGQEMVQITELIGSGRNQITMDRVPIDDVLSYACADADMSFRLWTILRSALVDEGLLQMFERTEIPLIPIIAKMQLTGVMLDVQKMHAMAETLGARLDQIQHESVGVVGHSFNLASPKQLGEVLFSELRLNESGGGIPPRKNKSGGYSTDATTLDSLRGSHPIVELVLEHRQLSKLKSTYVDAFPTLVDSKTGRLHTTYNQAGSVTGRVSSNDPNLQNIPIRTELGRQIRVAFNPGNPEWLLMAVDYSQIELRVLAHLSQDPELLDAFTREQDIHSSTAAQIFGVSLTDVQPEMRRIAKVLNFGVIYGLSPFGIAQQTQLSLEEGRVFIDSYFKRYPMVQDYLEGTKQKARETGYVETLLGRRRYTPQIHSPDPVIRQATEREAINMPVQGTAAEILKSAMIAVDSELRDQVVLGRMLLQVHDELIFEAPMSEIPLLERLVSDVMPRALEIIHPGVPFTVPLKVSTKVGVNWGELQ